ncbi:MAG: ATP-binding protein, partial [Gemmatimonadetes bacterium]|nr:ATP-binding protein [Gemmatimonadota bacterium]
RGVQLLLLDDVQFLAGQHRTQEELLRAWDALSSRGGQVVLSSDRPPQEIDGIDERLLSRFSGGLIVDIGAPDYETRVAIVRRKADERKLALGPEVAEALARVAFGNVRELQGALNRLAALQELEGRTVSASEVTALLGGGAAARPDEFGDFVAEIAGTVAAVTSSPSDRQLAEAIARWKREGFRARRLEAALAQAPAVAEVEALVRRFEAEVERLREIAGEISALEPGAPELEKLEILRDPDRLFEAEELLGVVRDRNRPLPAPPPGPTLDQLRLAPDLFALRAARAVAEAPGQRYNPLFVWGPRGAGKTSLLAAIGTHIQAIDAELPVAFLETRGFAAELIQALERNRLESWRDRYRRARVFLLDDVQALAGTERVQAELFHLFDVLLRAGAQLAFTADRPPAELTGIDERLRTRMESGLAVPLVPAGAAPPPAPRRARPAAAAAEPAEAGAGSGAPDRIFLDREKVIWDWPYAGEWLVEELD